MVAYLTLDPRKRAETKGCPELIDQQAYPSSVRNLISKTIIDEEIPLLVSIYLHKYIHIQNTSKNHIDILVTCWCLYWGVIDIQQVTRVNYKSDESSQVYRSGQLSKTRQWPIASPPTTHQQFPHRLLCPSIHVFSRCQAPSLLYYRHLDFLDFL